MRGKKMPSAIERSARPEFEGSESMASSAQKVNSTPAVDFEEELEQKFGSDKNCKKMLAREIMTFVTEQIEAKPDYTPENGGGYALSESAVISYQGALIRQDRIYEKFPSEEREVREALDWLNHGKKGDLLDGEWVDYSWLIKPVFRPDPALDRAVIWAREVKKAAKKNKPSKPSGLKNPPFSTLAAGSVLTGGGSPGQRPSLPDPVLVRQGDHVARGEALDREARARVVCRDRVV